MIEIDAVKWGQLLELYISFEIMIPPVIKLINLKENDTTNNVC